MVTDFNLETTKQENCLVMKTFGYINNIGGQKIVDVFNEHKDNGINNFILNLSESKIVNSIGISYLIEVIEKLNNSNGKLIFTNLDPTIEKTFTIMGLFQFAEKADTVEDAYGLI
ncbi:MAG: STAS domain-containing protein [Ignavibacteriae bacterium]|nr:STAS domain-containing protein [Ignavibacteriota bacterium]MCB9211348.1 STAS domain-containing protein [Ignavibacteriales bacterium]MCB9219753.1 STAS domain-containing protein [Ignavibacteriales bacterium]MCB9260015.1 STAS domain-containing protein [Ignavibacteriales bacterium]